MAASLLPIAPSRAIHNVKMTLQMHGFTRLFGSYFFLPPAPASSFLSHEMTLPNITTPFPSMKATRDRPSQFLKVSHTRGCCGWKAHSAISFDLSECGSSIFFPPVSLPIFQTSFDKRQAARPQRTNPIGEYPHLISFGMSKIWIWALNSFVSPKVVSFLYTITSPPRGMLFLSRPLMLSPTLSPGFAKSTREWCISTVNTFPVHGFEAVCVGKKTTSSPGFTTPCSTRPASTSPTPLIL